MDCSLPGSSVHGIFPAKHTGVGCHFLLQGNLPDSRIKLASESPPEVVPGGCLSLRAEPGSQHGADARACPLGHLNQLSGSWSSLLAWSRLSALGWWSESFNLTPTHFPFLGMSDQGHCLKASLRTAASFHLYFSEAGPRSPANPHSQLPLPGEACRQNLAQHQASNKNLMVFVARRN